MLYPYYVYKSNVCVGLYTYPPYVCALCFFAIVVAFVVAAVAATVVVDVALFTQYQETCNNFSWLTKYMSPHIMYVGKTAICNFSIEETLYVRNKIYGQGHIQEPKTYHHKSNSSQKY